jgi:hypothetical protein
MPPYQVIYHVLELLYLPTEAYRVILVPRAEPSTRHRVHTMDKYDKWNALR